MQRRPNQNGANPPNPAPWTPIRSSTPQQDPHQWGAPPPNPHFQPGMYLPQAMNQIQINQLAAMNQQMTQPGYIPQTQIYGQHPMYVQQQSSPVVHMQPIPAPSQHLPLHAQAHAQSQPQIQPHQPRSATAEMEKQLHNLLGLGIPAPSAHSNNVHTSTIPATSPLDLSSEVSMSSQMQQQESQQSSYPSIPTLSESSSSVSSNAASKANHKPTSSMPKKILKNEKKSKSKDAPARKQSDSKNRDDTRKNPGDANGREGEKKIRKPRLSTARARVITNEMLEMYYRICPEKTELARRREVVTRLQEIIDRAFQGCGGEVKVFGSSASGFGFKGADLDMCLMIDVDKFNEFGKRHTRTMKIKIRKPKAEKKEGEKAEKATVEEQEVDATGEALMVLLLEEEFTKLKFQDILALPKARIPVVKFVDPETNIGCDICFNNGLALRNTSLCFSYSCLDERVKPLAFAVKTWAKARRVNNTYEGTLSSYAYVLMVIHFLQSRRPSVLPCLQQLHRNTAEKVMVDEFDTYFYFDPNDSELVEWGHLNRESLGRLLYEFFYFYAYQFHFKDGVISPRKGAILTKKEKEWTKPVDRANRSNYWFCIEDPFELSHNLGRTVDKGSLFNLRYEFRRAALILGGSFPWNRVYPNIKNRPEVSGVLDMLCTSFSNHEKTVKV